jgi:hypothetical protein
MRDMVFSPDLPFDDELEPVSEGTCGILGYGRIVCGGQHCAEWSDRGKLIEGWFPSRIRVGVDALRFQHRGVKIKNAIYSAKHDRSDRAMGTIHRVPAKKTGCAALRLTDKFVLVRKVSE